MFPSFRFAKKKKKKKALPNENNVKSDYRNHKMAKLKIHLFHFVTTTKG